MPKVTNGLHSDLGAEHEDRLSRLCYPLLDIFFRPTRRHSAPLCHMYALCLYTAHRQQQNRARAPPYHAHTGTHTTARYWFSVKSSMAKTLTAGFCLTPISSQLFQARTVKTWCASSSSSRERIPHNIVTIWCVSRSSSRERIWHWDKLVCE